MRNSDSLFLCQMTGAGFYESKRFLPVYSNIFFGECKRKSIFDEIFLLQGKSMKEEKSMPNPNQRNIASEILRSILQIRYFSLCSRISQKHSKWYIYFQRFFISMDNLKILLGILFTFFCGMALLMFLFGPK